MNHNNGRGGRGRGRARGRGRSRANRNRNQNAAALNEGDYESSDSDDGYEFVNSLALLGALSRMGSRANAVVHLGADREVDAPGWLKKKILYTEDNIPVNTVYASFKLHHEAVNEISVRNMFEQFGPIKNVRIHTNPPNINMYGDSEGASNVSGRGGSRKYNRQEPRINRYGFIAFENCEDAAKCLQLKNKLAGCYVAAADSWHQEAYQKQPKEMETGAGEASSSSATVPTVDPTGNDEASATNAATGESQKVAEAEKTRGTAIVEEANNDETEQEGTNILQLNDDCLRLIFDRVELMELIALKNTCIRFEVIACNMLKHYKYFDFDLEPCDKAYLTMLDAKNILTEVGPFVEHLCISRDRFVRPGTRILNLIPRHCPNLKELEIRDFTLNSKSLKGLEGVFKSLESLSLTSCGINDHVERNLAHAIHLQRLDLSSNSEITGKCLKAVKNLKHLNLESCQNIQGKPFSAFTLKNKSLEYLNINCCNRLTSEAIKSIVKNMTELSHLVCNNSYENADPASMALIAKLPKLKKVQLKINSFQPIEQTLRSFAESNQLEHLDLSDGIFTAVDYNLLCGLTNLKELKLNYKVDFSDEHLAKLCTKGNFIELHIAGCTKVTDKQLLEFIKTNPLLKVLDISYCQITEGLLFSAIDILKEQAASGGTVGGANRPLKMVVGQTSICPVILNNALINNHRHLLEISFESTESGYGALDVDDMYDDVLDDDDNDFMGYDYEDDDSDLWGLDYDSDLDLADMCQYFYDSDDDDYRYIFMQQYF